MKIELSKNTKIIIICTLTPLIVILTLISSILMGLTYPEHLENMYSFGYGVCLFIVISAILKVKSYLKN